VGFFSHNIFNYLTVLLGFFEFFIYKGFSLNSFCFRFFEGQRPECLKNLVLIFRKL